MSYFEIDIVEFVATIRMRRDPVNAQSSDFRRECIAAFDGLGTRDDVRAIVLTGNGKTFSAGADLTDRPDPDRPGAYVAHNRLVRDTFDAILACPKPVIAAIDGPAIAAGFVLASVCDILLIADDTWISMPEVRVGLAGGVRHVLRHFGASNARLAMFTGRRISAAELYRMNVVSEAIPRDRLIERAREIALEIAGNAPLAVEAAKRSFHVGEELSVHTGYGYEQSQTARLASSADFDEARNAFNEKREPRFEGH
jgi:enoyl-CoA hydratase